MKQIHRKRQFEQKFLHPIWNRKYYSDSTSGEVSGVPSLCLTTMTFVYSLIFFSGIITLYGGCSICLNRTGSHLQDPCERSKCEVPKRQLCPARNVICHSCKKKNSQSEQIYQTKIRIFMNLKQIMYFQIRLKRSILN